MLLTGQTSGDASIRSRRGCDASIRLDVHVLRQQGTLVEALPAAPYPSMAAQDLEAHSGTRQKCNLWD